MRDLTPMALRLAASSACVLAARMSYNGGLVAGLVTLSAMLGGVSLTFALGVLR